mmetsp:Transcript_16908/g.22209  ORF Transcript_16908/g.22209 Transcript_16908/m.22209 type:complete len:200 (+) Transcript_16908:92-691(+)|eukprot:CAMPEP_0195267082 /NCGR_PEP_ID=MMETSP0706-20130129/12384_1 /TAXON_ID=33640 /ORGANISM="Asterionellopsis glacialis, Strain CCMP134" /LENGTH=199 /DNA_ID=CAMNT_0040321777 /DNA_START=60 /DNA_END=659 /DNA_ORIENTATION=+
MRVVVAALCVSAVAVNGFAPSTTTTNTRSATTELSVSRKDFLQTAFLGGAAAVTATTWGVPLPAFAGETVKTASGVTYTVDKSGDGPKPEIGELAAIRFRAAVTDSGMKIDDIFDTPEPYYTRIGSGGLIKGVEQILPLMRVGDRWTLNVPGELAFGPKGRPASAGKARIPSNAAITFEVEVVGLPGKEPELIDLIGDD